MPIHNVSNNGAAGNDKNASGRTTFRPPWVKTEPKTTAAAPVAPALRPWSQRQKAALDADATSATAADSKPQMPTLKKTNATPNATVKPKGTIVHQISEDTDSVKNGLKSLLRKTEPSSTPTPTTTTTTTAPTRPNLAASKTLTGNNKAAVVKDEPDNATKMAPGTVDKAGKFVRPVLKKFVRPEPAPIPVKAPPLKPTVMAAPKKIESEESSEEEEDDDEEVDEEEEEEEETEEETETETETESESEEEVVVVPPKKTPLKPAVTKITPQPTQKPTLKPTPKQQLPPPIPAAPIKPVLKTTNNATTNNATTKTPTPAAPQAAKVPTAAGAPPPPPPPPPPPGLIPPPPPPPPGKSAPPPEFEHKPISDKHRDYLERLKNRPRKRPDWSDMMKEVESGRKLRHVQCNDRSSPILTSKSITNIKGQFVYETEKANVHNILLKQIQFGVSLKQTKTNDRSKPVLAGLRKFRRQMTIEEQILKSESRAQLNEAPEEESEDEMDDIDKLRDDLQSSKQMLALEMRAKEAHERENKRLLLKVQMLEADLGREKSKNVMSAPGEMSTVSTAAEPPLVSSTKNEALLRSLKSEAEEAQKTCKLLETQYQTVFEHLDIAKLEIDEQKRKIALLEKQLSQGQSLSATPNNRQSPGGFQFDSDLSSESDSSERRNANNETCKGVGLPDYNRRQSEPNNKDSSPEPEADLSDVEDAEEDEEKKAERLARRLAREVKMMSTKLVRLKEKERAARKERENLREAMKKNQGLLKVELKKFKKLQREVDKMAAMMHEDEDGEVDDDEEPKAEQPEESAGEEDTEEESDSETEEECDSDDSESEAEDSTNEKKKDNYEPRIKRYDGRLAALKKGNYLVQANVDRLQDEINKMREKSVTLQADLDSVLSELG